MDGCIARYLWNNGEELHGFAEDPDAVSGVIAGGGELLHTLHLRLHRCPPPVHGTLSSILAMAPPVMMESRITATPTVSSTSFPYHRCTHSADRGLLHASSVSLTSFEGAPLSLSLSQPLSLSLSLCLPVSLMEPSFFLSSFFPAFSLFQGTAL